MAATYSDSTEARILREFNKDRPVTSFCIENDNKPSFSDMLKYDLTGFVEANRHIITDLIYKATNNIFELPSKGVITDLLLACKIVKESGYGIKSYDALEDGGVTFDLKFNHSSYLIVELYNSGDAVYYLERPNMLPLALDLTPIELFNRLGTDLE